MCLPLIVLGRTYVEDVDTLAANRAKQLLNANHIRVDQLRLLMAHRAHTYPVEVQVVVLPCRRIDIRCAIHASEEQAAPHHVPEIVAFQHFQQLDRPQTIGYVAVDGLQEIDVREVVVQNEAIAPLSTRDVRTQKST